MVTISDATQTFYVQRDSLYQFSFYLWSWCRRSEAKKAFYIINILYLWNLLIQQQRSHKISGVLSQSLELPSRLRLLDNMFQHLDMEHGTVEKVKKKGDFRSGSMVRNTFIDENGRVVYWRLNPRLATGLFLPLLSLSLSGELDGLSEISSFIYIECNK